MEKVKLGISLNYPKAFRRFSLGFPLVFLRISSGYPKTLRRQESEKKLTIELVWRSEY